MNQALICSRCGNIFSSAALPAGDEAKLACLGCKGELCLYDPAANKTGTEPTNALWGFFS